MAPHPHSLGKNERLSGHTAVSGLFAGGSRAVTAYPIRAVYRTSESAAGNAGVRILVSVPKRHFKHAVDRNRIKRQLRECYRLNKQPLCDKAIASGIVLDVAFIWISGSHCTTSRVNQRMRGLLQMIYERT